MRYLTIIMGVIILPVWLSSCRVSTGSETLDEGHYQSVKIKEGKNKIYQKCRTYVEDSLQLIRLTHLEKDSGRQSQVFSPALNSSLYLTRRKFDIDVFTIPFKIRMSAKGFPPQLNSNFNAAVYLGQRYDFYKVSGKSDFKKGVARVNTTRGLGGGVFFGLGSATMNPFVTQNYINYEYDGLIMDAGLALIYDAKVFNVGLAAGADHLFDKNKNYWLYQNRIWFGVLFGLNLN